LGGYLRYLYDTATTRKKKYDELQQIDKEVEDKFKIEKGRNELEEKKKLERERQKRIRRFYVQYS